MEQCRGQSQILTPKTQAKTPNSSPQDRSNWSYIRYKRVAAILDAILNYTFLPHIWNVYPSFFQSPMGPLQGSRVKIRGHDCTQDPPVPQDYGYKLIMTSHSAHTVRHGQHRCGGR